MPARDDVAFQRGRAEERATVRRARPQPGPRLDDREAGQRGCKGERGVEQIVQSRRRDARVETALLDGGAHQQSSVVARHQIPMTERPSPRGVM